MSLQFFRVEEEKEVAVEKNWNVVIIGAGPAGLTAGIYSTRMGLKTLILEEKNVGGRLPLIPWIENYPGFLSISGEKLASKLIEHARGSGAIILSPVKVTDLTLSGNAKQVVSDMDVFEAKAIVIATGAEERKLNVPGEEEFFGRGVSYCVVCDGPLFRNGRVAVVGGGNSAVLSAIYMSDLAEEVYLIHRRDSLRAEKALQDKLFQSKANIIWNSVVEEIRGGKKVEKLILRNKLTNELKALKVDGVFINIGDRPRSDLAVKAGINVDEKGYILTDKMQMTNVPGVFAAGDVAGKPEQISKAVGEGAVAAISAHRYVISGGKL